MDIRHTVITSKDFLPILAGHQERQDRVSLLIDQEGLTRLEGVIVSVTADENALKSRVQMDNGLSFLMEQVVAVNGLFRSDYSEC